MEERIIIRHLNASKANQTEEFPVKDNPEVTVGRDSESKIRYDSDREDLVSRRHAKITVDKSDPIEVGITDLGSSNGTFVNKQRVFSKVRLNPGDVVQLGPGGPEFQFDLNPRPAGSKATRMADIPGVVIAPTREATVPAAVTAGAPRTATPPTNAPRTAAPSTNAPAYTPSGSTAVGKATVERMITQTRTQTRNTMLLFGLALLAVIGGVSAYLLTRPKPRPLNNITILNKSGGVPSEQIASTNRDSVVYIECQWSLIDSMNGRTLSQVYVQNAIKDKGGKTVPIIPNAGATLPVFYELNGQVEPVLSTEDGGGTYQTINGGGRGSGFVVSNDGFILTNRHVGQGWETSYEGWREHGIPAGILLVPNGKDTSFKPIPASLFPNRWVPSDAKIVSVGPFSLDNLQLTQNNLGFARQVQGRNDVLNVTFAGNRIRIPAKVARSSDRADVSMIKIDLPRSLPKVEMNDDYETIQPGAQVVVMGYPAVTPDAVQVTDSVDALNSQKAVETIPSPTITDGNIGQVLRNAANNNGEEGTYSLLGDYYQLQINTTGAGNSGGPVFDTAGKVIGIFTLGSAQVGGAQVSYAVPIRYGMELMGISVSGH